MKSYGKQASNEESLETLLEFGRDYLMNDLNVACLADGHTDPTMVSYNSYISQ